MKNPRTRVLALLCAFFILLSAQPVARAADDVYAVTVTADKTEIAPGGEVTLTAEVTKNGTPVEDLTEEGLDLWFWPDMWRAGHEDGLVGVVPSNNEGKTFTVSFTLPDAGKYYLAAQLKSADTELAIDFAEITVAEPAKELVEIAIPNGDFETGDASNWVLEGYTEVKANSDSANNKTNALNLWLSNDAEADGSASYTVELTAGEYYFTFGISGAEMASGLKYAVSSAGTALVQGDEMTTSGWDVWETLKTESFTLEDAAEVTFTISGTQPAGYWGWLDDLKLFGTGAAGEETVREIHIPNGDFENGERNWTITATGTYEVVTNEWAANNKTNTLDIKNDNTAFSAAYTVTLTEGTYHFTFRTAGETGINGGLESSVTGGDVELAAAEPIADTNGWDVWNDNETGEFTLTRETEVTFLFKSEDVGEWWGNLDDLRLFGTGSVVVKAPDKVDAGIYVPYVEGTGGDDFFRGADVSSLLSILNSGATFKDWDGKSLGSTREEQGLGFMRLLKEAGVNWIRLRVWNEPYNAQKQGYGGGNNDVEAAKIMGKWATDAGLRVLIDFHYSDFWADPGKQQVPKAWKDFTVDQKVEAIRDFTTDSLTELLDAGVDVGMVQVGNETTNQICGESDWANKSRLFDAGCDAVHDVAAANDHPILAAIHFTNPERAGNYASFAEHLAGGDVSYDVFASSYYPYWHGTIENLTSVLKQVADKYDKEVIVAETSWAWTLDEGDGHDNTVRTGNNDNPTYPFSVQGQATEFATVAQAVKDVGSKGVGVFYWENAWIPVVNVSKLEGEERQAQIERNKVLWEEYGSGWASSYAGEYDPDDAGKWYGGSAVDNQAMFDFDGKPLESLNVFKYMTTGTKGYVNSITAVEAGDIEIVVGDEFGVELLPSKVTAVYLDGATAELAPVWNDEDIKAVDTTTAGTRFVGGTVTDEAGQSLGFTVKVIVGLKYLGENLLKNPGFEEGKVAYTLSSNWKGKGITDQESSNNHEGKWCLHFYSSADMTDMTAQQTVTLQPGTYAFTLFAQGGSVGENADIYSYVNVGEDVLKTPISMTAWAVWDTPVIVFKLTQELEVTVGVHVTAAGGGWGSFDDWLLSAVEGVDAPVAGPCGHPEASVEHIEAKAATYEADGNIEYWHCTECGRYFKDKELTQEIELAGTVLPKLTRPQSGGGLPAPGLPSTPTEPGSGVTTSGDETVAAPSANNGAADVTEAMGGELVEKTEANGSAAAVVAPQFPEGTNRAVVNIPGSTLRDLGERTGAELRVETPAANVTFPHGALGELGAGRTFTVTTEKTGDTVSITVAVDGRTVETVPGGIKAAVALGGGQVAVLVEDSSETVIPKSLVENGVTYVVLDGSATVKVSANTKDFSDVTSGDWFAADVAFASSHELFDGTGEGVFSPGADMDRAMLAAVLWRLESKAPASQAPSFPDVAEGQWYTGGVAWASEKGVVLGYDDGSFGTADPITRQELALMIYRYAGLAGLDTAGSASLSAFADGSDTAEWARTAVQWAVSAGILRGGDGRLDPTGTASRAEVAAVLQRLVGLIVKYYSGN